AATLAEGVKSVVAAFPVLRSKDTLTRFDDTLLLAAPASDAQGAVIAGTTAAWSSSDTSVAVFVGPGRLVARRNGQVTVQARVDNDTGTTSVVIAQRVARLQSTPPQLVLNALTAELTVSATGLDARGHPMAV